MFYPSIDFTGTFTGTCLLWLRHPIENKHVKDGGRGGIRTHGTVARTPDFESGAFNHSATLPGAGKETFCAGLSPGQAHSMPGQTVRSFSVLRIKKALAVGIRQRRCQASVGLLFVSSAVKHLPGNLSKTDRKQTGDIWENAAGEKQACISRFFRL